MDEEGIVRRRADRAFSFSMGSAAIVGGAFLGLNTFGLPFGGLAIAGMALAFIFSMIWSYRRKP